MKKLGILLLCLVSLCAIVAGVAGNWVATGDVSATGVIQRLDRARWIAAGAKSPARVVYVFIDPECPYCNDLWKAMRNVQAPDVQIRYLLVAVISADSRGKDAEILESADPAAALERNERNFDKGGIRPKKSWQPATAETLSANEALMGALHIFGTPGLVYVNERNELRVFAGMPDPQQLRAIVGKR